MKTFGITADDFGVQRHYAVHVKSDRSVTFSRSSLVRGKRRDNGKTWARWQLETRYGFWKTHKGTIVPFAREGKYWRSGDLAFTPLEHLEIQPFTLTRTKSPMIQAEEHYAHNVLGQFGVKQFTDLYPIAALKNLDKISKIPHSLVGDTRSPDIMDFTRRIFGKKNYRKDLVRAVADAPLPAVAVAKEFKNLVPVDWLVKFLNNSHLVTASYGNTHGLREILTQIDPRSYRRMLNREFTDQDMLYLSNVMLQYRGRKRRNYNTEIPFESFASFSDLHDRTIGNHGTFYQATPYKNRIVPIKTTRAQRLHGTKSTGLKSSTQGQYAIMCAMDTDDMKSWGEYMKNCIGGYGDNAVGGQFIYGAVFLNDDMIANFEVDPGGKLSQLLGRFNQSLDAEVREDLEYILDLNGVNIPAYYWGRPASGDLNEPFGLGMDLPDEWEPQPVPDDMFNQLFADLPPIAEPQPRIQVGRAYIARTDEQGNEVPF